MINGIELKEAKTESDGVTSGGEESGGVSLDPAISWHIFPSVTSFDIVNTGIAKDFNNVIPKAKEKMIGITYFNNG